MIYFLERLNGDIKIGYTNNYDRRLKQLSEAHGDLSLRGIMDGEREVESVLHQHFAYLRQNSTEWFRCDETLQQFIVLNTDTNIRPPKKLITVKMEVEAKVMLSFFASEHLVSTGEELTVSQTIIEMFRKHRPDIYERYAAIITEPPFPA